MQNMNNKKDIKTDEINKNQKIQNKIIEHKIIKTRTLRKINK